MEGETKRSSFYKDVRTIVYHVGCHLDREMWSLLGKRFTGHTESPLYVKFSTGTSFLKLSLIILNLFLT